MKELTSWKQRRTLEVHKGSEDEKFSFLSLYQNGTFLINQENREEHDALSMFKITRLQF